MKEFLERNGIFMSEVELTGLFERYDANKDGQITISEVFLLF